MVISLQKIFFLLLALITNFLFFSKTWKLVYIFLNVNIVYPPVSKLLKRKSAYRAKEAKANRFFEDMRSVSKAVKLKQDYHIAVAIQLFPLSDTNCHNTGIQFFRCQ